MTGANCSDGDVGVLMSHVRLIFLSSFDFLLTFLFSLIFSKTHLLFSLDTYMSVMVEQVFNQCLKVFVYV